MVRRFLGVLPVLCSLSCGEQEVDRSPAACLAYAAAGLRVEVTNVATAEQICDATVIASQGSYSEQLFGTSCAFIGAYERAGTYVLTAARAGLVPKEVGSVRVVMSGGQCPHVEQARVAIALTPDS
jgi:hypothetical protein